MHRSRYTILITLVITYLTGMLFHIAHDLAFPFEEGVQAIPLTHEFASLSSEILSICGFPDKLVKGRHESGNGASSAISDGDESNSLIQEDTPDISKWPSTSETTYGTLSTIHNSSSQTTRSAVRQVAWYARSHTLAFSLFVFVLWSILVTLLTRAIASPPEPGEVCRWWCVHLPVSANVMGYISLGLFLLLSFWLDDCYGQYESGLALWNIQTRRHVDELAVLISKVLPPEDRQRAMAHLTATIQVAAGWLRGTSDLSALEGVLSASDLEAVKASSDRVSHCITVLAGIAYRSERSCGSAAHAMLQSLVALEQTIVSCQSVKKVPVPPPYTRHLALFITIWLALLPFISVQQLGYLAVLVLLPVAYSVVNLFNIGMEMTDPFGTDPHDIPVLSIANEIRSTIRHSNHDIQDDSYSSGDGSETYSRQKFRPSSAPFDSQARFEITPTFGRTLRAALNSMPSVSAFPQVLATVWSVIAVILSRVLSYWWSPLLSNACRHWCSPIDIDTGTLGNIGFALFSILAFRAADAIQRYERGASLLYNLRLQLRTLAVELCLVGSTDSSNVLERVVAHLVQIPLSLRDTLLATVRSDDSKEGLLSDDDWHALLRHPYPVEYLIHVVESYVLKLNVDACEGIGPREPICPDTDRLVILGRVNQIREIVSTVYNIKRFPVIASYTQHQRVFTALWLFLLPLSLTPTLGWFTIICAPLIAYAVFGLETIANKLVDPFGDDDIDIPVDELCRNASNAVIDAVLSLAWGTTPLPNSVGKPKAVGLGVSVHDTQVHYKYNVARISGVSSEDEAKDSQDVAISFSSPMDDKIKPTMYAHIVHSLPWGAVITASVWALIVVTASFVLRDDVHAGRWWASRISISPMVSAFISFGGKPLSFVLFWFVVTPFPALIQLTNKFILSSVSFSKAFFLLGFYVRLAFARYFEAGVVWFDLVPGGCMSLVSSWTRMFDRGAWHEGDMDRVIGHIAAFPIVLKHSVRDSRDLRDLQGLLTLEDVVAIQHADDMPSRCVDVIRSYYYRSSNQSNRNVSDGEDLDGNRVSFIEPVLGLLDAAITSARFLKEFQFAQGFAQELNFLLGLWFVLLPFALAEVSGWLCPVWVFIIALAILGMYSVAEELQMPFGVDLNDLDLDEIADRWMQAVLNIYKEYSPGRSALIFDDGKHPIEKPGRPAMPDEKLQLTLWETLKISSKSVPWRVFVAVTVWAILSTTFVWLLSRASSFLHGNSCVGNWCSILAISGPVQTYIGFAFFLLLGFKLADSHSRYSLGQSLWNENLNLLPRNLVLQIYGAYRAGLTHDGDRSRMTAHATAAPTAIADWLHADGQFLKGLTDVVNADAAARIKSMPAPAFYCLDVISSYVMEADDRFRESGQADNARLGFHWSTNRLLGKFGASLGEILRIVNIPLPFGYVTHIRTFAVVWVAVLPLEIVESAGWMTIPWSILIAYSVLSIVTWAEQLAQPFGDDFADLPVETLRRRTAESVREVMKQMQSGYSAFICADRDAFPLRQNSEA